MITRSQEGLALVMVAESVRTLKGFLALTELEPLALGMVLRMVLAFVWHRGRMSCSAAAGSLASATVHRGELTRFLARPRWPKIDFNAPLRKALLAKEAGRGRVVRLTFCFFARREDFEQKQTQGTKGRDPSDFDGLAKVASRLNPLFPSVQDWVAAQGRAGFIVDATRGSQAGAKTQNTHRQRRIDDEHGPPPASAAAGAT